MTFKRTEFPSLKLVGLLIAAVCLSGCNTITYSVSQPQPIPDISKLKKRQPGGYALRLKLPDVEVDVMAENRVSPSSPWPGGRGRRRTKFGDKLLVFVALSPKTDGVRFDPSRMRYQPDDGELPDHPWLVQGPARKHSVSQGRFKTCFPPWYMRQAIYPPVTGSVPVTERACFRIFFNDDRTEHRAFTLFIEGISKSGKPVEVPTVEFWRKTWTETSVDW